METTFLLNTFHRLIPFLEAALGPSAEIVLHDLTKNRDTIIAMGGTSFTGRKTGDSISALGKEISSLAEVQDFVSGNRETTAAGHELRTNTFFIKDASENLVGLLCIHLDIGIPLKAVEYLSALIGQGGQRFNDSDHALTDRVESLADRLIDETLGQFPVAASRMTSKEKQSVIDLLCKQSVFRIKGSVSKVAQRLSLSEPTVYRYLKELTQPKQ